MSQEQQAPQQSAEEAVVFSIEKIYVKDFSLEVPHAPAIYLEREMPSVDIDLHTAADAAGEGYYEASLTVTVKAALGEKTVFLVEVTQAGIFQIRNVPDEALNGLLAVACPSTLYPYAREAVSDAVTRAGFPPVVLAPANFEAMYMARLQEEAAAQPQQ